MPAVTISEEALRLLATPQGETRFGNPAPERKSTGWTQSK
jgi:hypothetical protein